MKKRNFLASLMAAFTLLFLSNVNAQQADEKSKALVVALEKVNGGYETLWNKKDVQYTYEYNSIGKGIDVSTEKHIFNGEQSYGEYKSHKALVFPGKEGTVIQSLVDEKATVTVAGNNITDPKAVGMTTFLRKVNIFWFSMMYKLDDPGTILTYLGKEEVNGVSYDKVSLNYEGAITKKEANDAYVLYFNPNTHLIDLFYFSLPAMGIHKAIIKMTLDYEIIEGVYVATVRKSFVPNKKGGYQANGIYTTKEVKFNNGFTKKDLSL